MPDTPQSLSPELSVHVRQLQQLLAGLGAVMFTKDRQGRYTWACDNLLRLLNTDLSALQGRTDVDWLSAEDFRSQNLADQHIFDEGETVGATLPHHLPGDPDARRFLSVRTPLYDAQGRIVGLMGIAREVVPDDQPAGIRAEDWRNRVLDNIRAYVYIKDEHRRFRYVNLDVAKLLGQSPEAITGRLDSEVMPAEKADELWALDERALRSGCRQEAEERFTNAEGETRTYWSARQPFTDRDGRRYLIGFSSDITELAELRDQLKVLAETDTLTGLSNRRMFFESGYREFLRSRRYRYPMSLVLMDVDHFKRINDTLGHPVGDQVLEHVAETLRQHVREQDVLARVGGEEFAVLLPHTDLRGAIEMAERLREAIADARLVQPDTASVSVTVSLGVAIGRDTDTRLEDMLTRADKAMYEAKQRGRDQVCCHERF